METLENRDEPQESVEETEQSPMTFWRAMRRFPFRDPEPQHRRIAVQATFVLLLGTAALFGAMLGLALVYCINLPQMAELERYRPSTTTELYDIHGKIVGSFALERRIVVPYSEIPPMLREAILSIEDKDFESNSGINLLRILEAAYTDVHSHGKAQGGSTLTMQLARNLFLSSEKTYTRKVQEIFLTLQIERRFTKQQIFTLYANQIYLGRGTYGFEAASEYYFSKHASDLTLPEAALLAALPKGAEYYSPVRYPDRAVKRRNLVLAEMLEDHKITPEQAEEAKVAPLGLHLEAPANTEAPYFVEEVRRQLEREYGVDEAHGAGLRVYTTLDLDLQRVAKQALLDGLAAYERRHGWKGHLQNVLTADPSQTADQQLAVYQHPDWAEPIAQNAYFHALVTKVSPGRMEIRIGKRVATMVPADWAWTQHIKATDLAQPGNIVYVKVASAADAAPLHVVMEQDSGAQGSLMAVDNSNGEVLAMVGGRDFALSQFNRATQAERQVGSSFKIYDYTAAFEAGMKPYDTVLDTPTTFSTPGGPYTPHDYERGDFVGSMSLIDAFAESRNIPALRLADKVGIKTVIEVAHRFGVTSNIPAFLPVAIGAADITLEEQVGSYSVFPNDGIRIEPHFIRRVAQPDGLPLAEKTPQVRSVISVGIAREMMILLQAVVQHGTAGQASQMNHALGGKTGTTNNYTDAWFLGFSPSVTCGTWVGFDNRQSLGEKETGAKAALPIWIQFMKAAIADKPDEQFSKGNAPKKQIDVPLTPSDESPQNNKPDDTGDEPDNDAGAKQQPPVESSPAVAPGSQPAAAPPTDQTTKPATPAPIVRQAPAVPSAGPQPSKPGAATRTPPAATPKSSASPPSQ